MAPSTTNTSCHPWLTAEFFENILKSSENNENVKVNDFAVNDAVPKGENYGSYMIRATINYTDEIGPKQKSLVIKTLLNSAELNAMVEKSGLFDKEVAFYRDILPKYKKYTDLIDKDYQCSPRCYAASINPTYLVFEDLTPQNYRNMDRRIGLDFHATAMVLRKLAKLHAINAMIYKESPELFEHHKIKVVSRENPEILSAFTNGLKTMKTVCLKWPGYEQYTAKLDPLLNQALEVAESVYSFSEDTFNTLTHGDLWVNNIMYQFDETNTPIDVRMVDFQIGYYGSPATDISYIFYSSTANNIFERDWDRLLQIYHGELVSALKLVQYPNNLIPSLTEIQIQLLKKSLVAVMIALSGVAIRQMDSSVQPDLDTLLSEETKDVRLALYDKPVVIERLQYLLDYFDRKGFFEGLSK